MTLSSSTACGPLQLSFHAALRGSGTGDLLQLIVPSGRHGRTGGESDRCNGVSYSFMATRTNLARVWPTMLVQTFCNVTVMAYHRLDILGLQMIGYREAHFRYRTGLPTAKPDGLPRDSPAARGKARAGSLFRYVPTHV